MGGDLAGGLLPAPRLRAAAARRGCAPRLLGEMISDARPGRIPRFLPVSSAAIAPAK